MKGKGERKRTRMKKDMIRRKGNGGRKGKNCKKVGYGKRKGG